MVGSSDVQAALRDLVAEGPGAYADALRITDTLPLRGVLDALHHEFQDEHGEAVSRFLRTWLAHLGPFEQAEVAAIVADQHLLGLVHVEHSYGIGAQVVLESLERVTAATAGMLEALRAFTDGPDAEIDEGLADELESLAPQIMDVRRSIEAVHAAALRQISAG
ncbi:hypothetical protein CLV28_2950 [Sediminihabitans luteus]|uniref:Uncharacterized protein n=1 Tax=Sediminihabitans luteus TaxID=1138585 RepID=A0A2M9CBT6_9CELL|nr:hypothetical protein [Sediminihabitans luteus]PJJ68534.1 hypothetical protein CLV28_2950 [Sediminihabitans luteus]GII99869.1 hypothetical protein Slu03_22470 [Sediminihabitans luteus]